MASVLTRWSSLKWVAVNFNLAMLLGMVMLIAVLRATADRNACDPVQLPLAALLGCPSGGHDGPPLAELLLLWVVGDFFLLAFWLRSLPAPLTCLACGNKVKPGATICPSCGRDTTGFVSPSAPRA